MSESENESFETIHMLPKNLLDEITKHSFSIKKVDKNICCDEQKMETIVNVIEDIQNISNKLKNIRNYFTDSESNDFIGISLNSNETTKKYIIDLYNNLCNPVIHSIPSVPSVPSIPSIPSVISSVPPIPSIVPNLYILPGQYGHFVFPYDRTYDNFIIDIRDMTKNTFYSVVMYQDKYKFRDNTNEWPSFYIYQQRLYDVYLSNDNDRNKFIEFLCIISTALNRSIMIDNRPYVGHTANSCEFIYVHKSFYENYKGIINFRLVNNCSKTDRSLIKFNTGPDQCGAPLSILEL